MTQKEVIENTEKKREEKKTNVPINLPIRNSSSHAIIWKSHKDKEMGEEIMKIQLAKDPKKPC